MMHSIETPQNQESAQALFIATELGETESRILGLIKRIILVCGDAFATEMLHEAKAIFASGGLLTQHGDRQRTLGGIFFYLVKTQITGAQRAILFPRYKAQVEIRHNVAKPVAPPVLPFEWEDRAVAFAAHGSQYGEVKNMEIRLVGTPLKFIEQGECVITMMNDQRRQLSLPKGLPNALPGTVYGVYIARKQYQKIREALRNPNDRLIVKGHAAFDKELKMMCVFATSVSTVETEKALKAAQQAKETKAEAVG